MAPFVRNLERVNLMLNTMLEVTRILPPITTSEGVVNITSEQSNRLLLLNTIAAQLRKDQTLLGELYTKWSRSLEELVTTVALLTNQDIPIEVNSEGYRKVLRDVDNFLVIYAEVGNPSLAAAEFYNILGNLDKNTTYACYESPPDLFLRLIISDRA